jgi:hypothetical protein
MRLPAWSRIVSSIAERVYAQPGDSVEVLPATGIREVDPGAASEHDFIARVNRKQDLLVTIEGGRFVQSRLLRFHHFIFTGV